LKAERREKKRTLSVVQIPPSIATSKEEKEGRKQPVHLIPPLYVGIKRGKRKKRQTWNRKRRGEKRKGSGREMEIYFFLP